MANIRYGARTPEQLRNRELELTSIETWATTLTIVYETDADLIAQVLPRPLAPSADPIVRIAFATVDIGRGYGQFGAGTVAVEAVHTRDDGTQLIGGYPLVMPMTTEQAVVGGRETFGEPKKISAVTLTRGGGETPAVGDEVQGIFARMGIAFVEVNGRITAELPPTPDRKRTDFYFKFLLDPAGTGFDADPSLIYCHRQEKTRSCFAVDGDIVLRESRFDPLFELPVRKIRSIEFAERASSQTGVIMGTVPGEWIRPFVHQRYDDMNPLGSD